MFNIFLRDWWFLRRIISRDWQFVFLTVLTDFWAG